MNKNALKAVMISNGDTQRAAAKALGISAQTVGDKINGRSDFKQSEIKTLKDRYKLTPAQVDEIFFGVDRWNDL